jgi:hypothetical protein
VSDETKPEHGKLAQIVGPAARPPVTPQVRSENLNACAPRQPTRQWRPDDPTTIIEDMRERLQPGDGKAHPR